MGAQASTPGAPPTKPTPPTRPTRPTLPAAAAPRPIPTIAPTKKGPSAENQYEPLPSMKDEPPPPPPPSSCGGPSPPPPTTKVHGYTWWGSKATPPPEPPPKSATTVPPPPTIRAPEDKNSKVKWNNENYQTLKIAPPSQEVFKEKQPKSGSSSSTKKI